MPASENHGKGNSGSSILKVALGTNLVHCIVGNMVGITSDGTGILPVLFLPYSFIGGLSAFAGWDWLSLALELISFLLLLTIHVPLIMLFKR